MDNNRDSFKPLANPDAASNPSPNEAPVQIMGSGAEANWKSTKEAPCTESDGRPMNADSFHHRGK